MEEQRKFPKYWLVLVMLNWSEPIFDFLLYSWFPYYAFKIIFLAWILVPNAAVAWTIYRNCVHPLLCHLEQKIDCCVKEIKRQDHKTILRMGETSWQFHQYSQEGTDGSEVLYHIIHGFHVRDEQCQKQGASVIEIQYNRPAQNFVTPLPFSSINFA